MSSPRDQGADEVLAHRALAPLEVAIARGDLVADLGELIALESVTGDEHRSTQWLANRLRGLGAHVDHWRFDLEDLQARPDFPGWEAPRTDAWGVVGTWGEGEPALILAGHLDVVPPGDLTAWTTPPFTATVREGRVYGRGAADMLGGVVAMLAAVAAVTEAGLEPSVAVHGLVGEEDGGVGAFGTMARGHFGAACVIPEPTAGTVITANAGALTFRLTVPGLAAHGSTRYLGVDPIEKLALAFTALRALEAERNRIVDPAMAGFPLAYPLAFGTIHGGEWASTVPDYLVVEGRYGVALDEHPSAARREFEACITRICAEDAWLCEHPIEVEWWGGQFSSGRLPAGHELVASVQTAARAAGDRAPLEAGAPYGSDLRHYAAAGIPTVHYGPGSVAQAHTVDEWLDIEELHTSARALTALIVARCLNA